MLRRLILGMLVGLVVGAGLAAGLARLIGTSFVVPGGFAIAFASAAVAGALTGMVAGKPIWAAGAKVEAGVKAFFGALIEVITTLDKVVVRGKILRWRPAARSCVAGTLSQFGFESLGNRPGYLFLQGNGILGIAIDGVRPKEAVVGGLNQVRGDPHSFL